MTSTLSFNALIIAFCRRAGLSERDTNLILIDGVVLLDQQEALLSYLEEYDLVKITVRLRSLDEYPAGYKLLSHEFLRFNGDNQFPGMPVFSMDDSTGTINLSLHYRLSLLSGGDELFEILCTSIPQIVESVEEYIDENAARSSEDDEDDDDDEYDPVMVSLNLV